MDSTNTKIARMEENLKRVEEKFDVFTVENNQKHEEIMKTMVEKMTWIHDRIEVVEKSKAGKWVENVLWGFGSTVGGYLLYTAVTHLFGGK